MEVKEVKEFKGRYIWKIDISSPILLSFNFPSELSELTSFNFFNFPKNKKL